MLGSFLGKDMIKTQPWIVIRRQRLKDGCRPTTVQIVIDGKERCRRRGFGYRVSSEAGPVSLNADPLIRGMRQNVAGVTRIDFRWSQLEQTLINESTGPMITNIYGKQLSDLEKMRVEEKIRHVKEAIPDEVYEVLTAEWRRFVTRSVEQGQGEMKLEEFDYYFELFMKFPH